MYAPFELKICPRGSILEILHVQMMPYTSQDHLGSRKSVPVRTEKSFGQANLKYQTTLMKIKVTTLNNILYPTKRHISFDV